MTVEEMEKRQAEIAEEAKTATGDALAQLFDEAQKLNEGIKEARKQAEDAEKRKQIFNGYQINDAVMASAKSDAMVPHCLPAHREEEITEKVFEAHADEIFEEAENRLHAQKAVMVKLMEQ